MQFFSNCLSPAEVPDLIRNNTAYVCASMHQVNQTFLQWKLLNAAVLKLGVATLFRVAKYFLRVAKIFYYITLP